MNPDLFLAARVGPPHSCDNVAWLTDTGPPYTDVDPIDFAAGKDIQTIFRLYEQVYRPLDPLNVLGPEQLLEFNRWILVVNTNNNIIGFVALKTTASGLKLCLTATDGSVAARSAVKALNRNGLNVLGIYAEVSGKLEKAVQGYVPLVNQALVEGVLQKSVKPDKDGHHYTREIRNVGSKRKILVGRPLSS